MENLYCFVLEVKEEHAQEYIDIHENPWPEVLKAIRDSGVKEEILFFYKNLSIVLIECEDYALSEKVQMDTDICRKWEDTIAPWIENPGIHFPKKIFHLTEQLQK